MAPRASVVNCAAKATLPAATRIDATEHFIKNLNNFFLHQQNMLITSYKPVKLPKVSRRI
jgi:hypothetical protein